MINAAQSLAASADLADTIGRPMLAEQYRLWARDAADMGSRWGNALFSHFARDAAEYVTAAAHQENVK